MRAKRVLSLVIAVLLIVSIFAIPVSAAYDKKACPLCRSSSNVTLWTHATSWTTYGSNSCGHGGSGTDVLQRGTCRLKCFTCEYFFDSTERTVLCGSNGNRYY